VFLRAHLLVLAKASAVIAVFLAKASAVIASLVVASVILHPYYDNVFERPSVDSG
jgi:hypothetical protein